MLKINDKGLTNFKDEYSKIIIRKLFFSDEYSRTLNKIKTSKLKKFINTEVEKLIITDNIDLEIPNLNNVTKLKTIFDVILEEISITSEYKTYIYLNSVDGRSTKKEQIKQKFIEYGMSTNSIDFGKLSKKENRDRFKKENLSNVHNLIEDSKIIDEIISTNFKNKVTGKDIFNLNIKKLKNEELKRYITKNILKILVCETKSKKDYNSQLRQIIFDINKIINEKISVNPGYDASNDLKVLETIFDYDKYISGKSLRNEILNNIGINVCPYCGRQFISSYDDKENKRNSADLDHFYYKDKYPYLALSLFNFIPTCHICNSRNKKTVDFYYKEHLYPYEEGFDKDAKFDIDYSTLITDIINGKEKAKIIIDINNKKIENNLETFRLESLYQNHSKDVQDIFRMIQIYSPTYLKDIAGVLYDNDEFDNEIKEMKDSISKIKTIDESLMKNLKDKLTSLEEKNKSLDLAMKAEDMMLLMFKEKDNDEILSKLYNDLLDKYWRRNR